MAHPQDIRRLALQMLYQIDARNGQDVESVRESILWAHHDPSGRFPGAWAVPNRLEDARDHARAFERALGAWETREESDRLAASLAPDWPPHRQPAIDRNIIRLCWFEMTRGGVPPKAAVNEAVELAKTFGTERSAPFLNGVLDRMLRHAVAAPHPTAAGESPEELHPTDHGSSHPAAPVPRPDPHTDFWTSDR